MTSDSIASKSSLVAKLNSNLSNDATCEQSGWMLIQWVHSVDSSKGFEAITVNRSDVSEQMIKDTAHNSNLL